jgi:hypothetical protein
MKTLTAIVTSALLGIAAAHANEKHIHAEGGGLFGQPPEYVHLLLNPLPVYGLALGILALGAALLARSKPAQAVALAILLVGSASAWPVFHYGQNAYARIREKADDAGQQWLDQHMERAEKSIYIFYVTAVLAIAGLISVKKFPKVATPLALLTLVTGAASVGVGGWISKAGGQIRHPEFRAESAHSTNAASHEHGSSQQSHERMQQTNATGSHKHETTSEQSAEKTPMPDTLEGVWKAIHEHHRELESAVNETKFSEVQSHARELGALAKRLIELTPSDRKSVVENGANKMDAALAELRSSAETGSDSVMKTRFKEFAQALEQLEQQTKKQ